MAQSDKIFAITYQIDSRQRRAYEQNFGEHTSVLQAIQPTSSSSPFEQPGVASTMPTVIILASGRGARFAASGGATHKLQAQLMGKTVLQHTLDAVQGSSLPWHLEDEAHPGMGDSIAAAVQKTSQANGWLILPADLPLIQSSSLKAVAVALMNQEVVVPVYRGQRGHPVGFSVACRRALLDLQGDSGAARVVRSHVAMELHLDDRGCVTDIDTVEDLQVAERLLYRMGPATLQPCR
jgi:molybdenum cofactor cytidylyltransferase